MTNAVHESYNIDTIYTDHDVDVTLTSTIAEETRLWGRTTVPASDHIHNLNSNNVSRYTASNYDPPG